MEKILVSLNTHGGYNGERILRWHEEDAPAVPRRKPTAKKKTKQTIEVVPRSSDETKTPKISHKMWMGLRDNDSRHIEQ